jgi:broad specificity phosphatase PhoE
LTAEWRFTMLRAATAGHRSYWSGGFMPALRRLVLLRHGDTLGDSHSRYHGRNDVGLSDRGRSQMKQASRTLSGEALDLVVASPLRRSWQSARIVSGGAPVRLEPDFREIDFGRWEGLTAEEIEARDPILYNDWQARVLGFEFPSGELRADFRKRVIRGLERLEASDVASVLAVIHKGVIRTIAEHLLGDPLEDGLPELGQAVSLTRRPDGTWFEGRRSSDPPGIRSPR